MTSYWGYYNEREKRLIEQYEKILQNLEYNHRYRTTKMGLGCATTQSYSDTSLTLDKLTTTTGTSISHLSLDNTKKEEEVEEKKKISKSQIYRNMFLRKVRSGQLTTRQFTTS